MAALAVTLPLVPSSFSRSLHTHTLPDTESSKVGKTEKIQPAVSRRKSPIQRRYNLTLYKPHYTKMPFRVMPHYL